MEEKLNWKAIDGYSLSFSGKLIEKFFAAKQHISGREILQLSPVKQVNFFIIDELLLAWKDAAEKSRSPYFDFNAEEVKESYQHFLNVLSNNILIGQGHFAPLLKNAVTNTLLLVFAPYDFFSLYIKDKEVIAIEQLEERLKYIKINNAPLQGLLGAMKTGNHKKLSGTDAFKILDRMIQDLNFIPEDFETYTSQFSQVLPLNHESFYTSSATIKASPTKSSTPPAPTSVKAEKHSYQEPEKETLADNFQRVKITKIKESLSINQRFMFVNVLFKGDAEKFGKSIEFIDSCADRSVAFRFITENFSDWDKESEEYLEFMELLEKRFL
jgi:hypothetical protein